MEGLIVKPIIPSVSGAHKKMGVEYEFNPHFPFVINEFLQGFYVDRSRAFFALLDVKTYPLAFLQSPKTLHTDS